jgi:hypothetical protein
MHGVCVPENCMKWETHGVNTEHGEEGTGNNMTVKMEEWVRETACASP